MNVKTKILSILVVATPFLAQAQVHEISGATNAGIGLADGNTTGIPIAESNKSNTVNLYLATGYAYRLTDELQVAAELTAGYLKVGPVNDKDFNIAAGANYNFGNFVEATYVGARGVYTYSGYNFAIKGLVGKRIPLAANLTWNPEVSFIKFITGANSQWAFDLKLINLAVHF